MGGAHLSIFVWVFLLVVADVRLAGRLPRQHLHEGTDHESEQNMTAMAAATTTPHARTQQPLGDSQQCGLQLSNR